MVQDREVKDGVWVWDGEGGDEEGKVDGLRRRHTELVASALLSQGGRKMMGGVV